MRHVGNTEGLVALHGAVDDIHCVAAKDGDWHAIALNSNVDSHDGSPQSQWLRADLGASRSRCTIAYWHHPVFSSGPNGNDTHMRDVWRILYEAGVDVIVNGHDHLYERFAPQDPDGRVDSTPGIRGAPRVISLRA